MKTALIGCGLFLGGFACPGQSPETGESLTAGVSPYVAPTHTERFHYYLKHTFSVESLVRGAAGSGISQWSDTPSEWGQGAAGYARRYGNSYAQHTTRQSIIHGVADVLGEDNRYIRTERSGLRDGPMDATSLPVTDRRTCSNRFYFAAMAATFDKWRAERVEQYGMNRWYGGRFQCSSGILTERASALNVFPVRRSMNSTVLSDPSMRSRATVAGSRNRLGPALPGLT